jgi:ribokinase
LSICAIGDLILDVIVLPVASPRVDADTPAAIRFCAGGQAANVAAWASALGARSRLICARGEDFSSELTTAELASHGVEICGPTLEGRGGVVVSIGDAGGVARGTRTMVSDRGVATGLTPADIDPAWVRSCDVLHVSGYCLLREPMAAAAIEAAGVAPRVTVDLASAHDIERTGAKRFADRLQALAPEVAFATELERAAVPDFDTQWVIKLGARGARFPEGDYAAAPVELVDATGAGDALAAGYLVGGPALAIEAAGRCVSHIGAMPAAEARARGDVTG